MGEKMVVGPINKGLRTDRTAFVIDNDSFPTLINAYQWRGRVKRKRGTSSLGRLQRYVSITSLNINNLISGLGLESTSSIVPGTVRIVGSGGQVYTENTPPDGNLNGNTGGSGTINYATGAYTITGALPITGSFNYYPDLPVMGLEDLALQSTQFPGTLAFDTTYSYNISTSTPYSINDVSYYKNPATGTYAGYTQKTTWTPTTWNGQNYQQFWSTNYQGAFWTTNGINVPFSVTNIGMQYKVIVAVTVTSTTTASLQITGHGLVVGDFVFINEVVTTTGINFQTGYVTTVTNANNVIVTFPNATIASNGTGGIAQYLTSRSDTTKDCLRWYDGDPTDSNPTNPTFIAGNGWVNFAPPLSQFSYSIADLPSAQYYLVGARIIVPFKDRLLFIGPVVQTSSAGSQIYLQDTIIYSQNGTPFYTCSYTNSPTAAVDNPISPTNAFHQLLVPTNQTATPSAYFEDQSGFGGFISAGVSQPILTASENEDVLILGFSNIQARLVYTGNDVVPFNIYVVNSELGSGSTFSAINLDQGVITKGSRGFVITSQTSTQRIDLEIPDQVFQTKLVNNGPERVSAQRDYLNEWIYFSYPSNEFSYVFPTQTLQYNYRDNSWAIFNESYTTYGSFRKKTGYTWATIGTIYPSWQAWNTPWNSGGSTLLQPIVIAGNQQGFVIERNSGTGEANSLYIQGFSGSTVTSPNHCLNNEDYIVISGCLGTISSQVNGNIFSVANATANTFDLNPTIGSGTYLGGGLIKRMYVPFIATKQFPTAWELGRKTRLGPQQYLLTKTPAGQIQLLIFLSQNNDFAYNDSSILPSLLLNGHLVINDSLIYSTVLYTCPESTNLGLTPANINLQTPTAANQQQIWHRMNTSLIGDTVQIGFTLSDEQMRDTDFNNQFEEIELHGFILDVNPSQLLV